MKPGEKGPNDGYGQGYALLTVSITFALFVTLCLLAGTWLDRKLGLTPIFTLLGLLTGLGLGGFWGYQRIQRESGGGERKK